MNTDLCSALYDIVQYMLTIYVWSVYMRKESQMGFHTDTERDNVRWLVVNRSEAVMGSGKLLQVYNFFCERV